MFRGMNLLFGVMKLRGMPVPEYSHPAWNDSSRALQSASLKGSVLKGTIICSHYRGPYKSGKAGYDLQSVARKLLLTCGDEYLEALSTFEKNQIYAFVYWLSGRIFLVG